MSDWFNSPIFKIINELPIPRTQVFHHRAVKQDRINRVLNYEHYSARNSLSQCLNLAAKISINHISDQFEKT